MEKDVPRSKQRRKTEAFHSKTRMRKKLKWSVRITKLLYSIKLEILAFKVVGDNEVNFNYQIFCFVF